MQTAQVNGWHLMTASRVYVSHTQCDGTPYTVYSVCIRAVREDREREYLHSHDFAEPRRTKEGYDEDGEYYQARTLVIDKADAIAAAERFIDRIARTATADWSPANAEHWAEGDPVYGSEAWEEMAREMDENCDRDVSDYQRKYPGVKGW